MEHSGRQASCTFQAPRCQSPGELHSSMAAQYLRETLPDSGIKSHGCQRGGDLRSQEMLRKECLSAQLDQLSQTVPESTPEHHQAVEPDNHGCTGRQSAIACPAPEGEVHDDQLQVKC